MHSQNHWGGTFDIDGAEDDQSRNMDIDRGALQHQHQLDETQQSWLLGPPEAKKKDRYVDLGCVVVKRKLLWWMLWAVLGAFVLIGVPIIIAKNIPKKKPHAPPPDKYTEALHKALLFFNAQKSGKLPKNNGIPWRGNSGMKDGADLPDVKGGLVGGYYDAGDNIKFHFPMAFSMTLLSWSVVEYGDRYKAIGEYDHVRELIKWGTDYLLRTFNSSASTINKLYSQDMGRKHRRCGSSPTAARGGSVQGGERIAGARREDEGVVRELHSPQELGHGGGRRDVVQIDAVERGDAEKEDTFILLDGSMPARATKPGRPPDDIRPPPARGHGGVMAASSSAATSILLAGSHHQAETPARRPPASSSMGIRQRPRARGHGDFLECAQKHGYIGGSSASFLPATLVPAADPGGGKVRNRCAARLLLLSLFTPASPFRCTPPFFLYISAKKIVKYLLCICSISAMPSVCFVCIFYSHGKIALILREQN